MKAHSFCLVTTFYPPHHFGGDAVFVERLGSALASDGHQVEVIYDSDAFFLGSEMARPSAEGPFADRVPVHDIGRGTVGKADLLVTHQLGRPVLKRAEIGRLLAKREFDVVHFHNVSLLGGPGLLRQGNGVKLCTLHDYWFVCAMHALWRYDREACTERTCIRCTIRGGRPVQWWRYTGSVRRNARAIDEFITGSRFSRDAHIRNGFPREIEVLPHFVPDVPALRDDVTTPLSDRPFVLYAGRLETLKGIEDLLRFFREFRSLDLVVAGTGTLEERLRREAAGLAHVRFAGWLDDHALRSLYRQALAVVVPSLCYETFGLSAVEAFAHGTPAIVRDIGALSELVTGGGAVCYSGDEQLAGHLDRLRLNEAWRAQLAGAAMERYEQCFTARAHLSKYYALIERLQERRSR